jgi:hypothetical protein
MFSKQELALLTIEICGFALKARLRKEFTVLRKNYVKPFNINFYVYLNNGS